MSTAASKLGCIVRGSTSYVSQQGSVYAAGIRAETVGSTAVFLGMVTLPPGGRTKANVYVRHESAFYFLSGEQVETCTGSQLEHREVALPGDYIFIPANVPHVAVNRGKTPAVFLGARNDAFVHESMVMLPELDELVP